MLGALVPGGLGEQRVAECLLRRGPGLGMGLQELLRGTGLEMPTLRNCLLVLVQHNCVQPFSLSPAEGASAVSRPHLSRVPVCPSALAPPEQQQIPREGVNGVSAGHAVTVSHTTGATAPSPAGVSFHRHHSPVPFLLKRKPLFPLEPQPPPLLVPILALSQLAPLVECRLNLIPSLPCACCAVSSPPPTPPVALCRCRPHPRPPCAVPAPSGRHSAAPALPQVHPAGARDPGGRGGSRERACNPAPGLLCSFSSALVSAFPCL